MPREGCSCEDTQQSAHSPGVVLNAEEVIYALTDPHTIKDGSVKEFSKSKLKGRDLSICRARHSSVSLIAKAVIDPLTRSGNSYHGALWALTSEIREIPLGESGVGAFCVADDGLAHDSAHAVLGFSEARIELRNHREAARGNLKELFLRRGAQELEQCPFPRAQDGQVSRQEADGTSALAGVPNEATVSAPKRSVE
jgi:hypothetical protein